MQGLKGLFHWNSVVNRYSNATVLVFYEIAFSDLILGKMFAFFYLALILLTRKPPQKFCMLKVDEL